jgi:FAD-linked oxidoreductase
MSQSRFVNWARTQSSDPVKVCYPGTEGEILDCIRKAGASGQKVRLVGAGHSWSDIVCTEGVLISLDKFNRVVRVDKAANTVTVEAGVRLKDMIRVLHDHGLSMLNLGSIADQSAAGALSTGTHGSGIEKGILSTQVLSLRLITASGEVLELNRTNDESLFLGALVSLGSLGVISQLTLQCEPLYCLEESSRSMPFEQAIEEMMEIVSSHEWAKFWWLPYTDTVQLFTCQRKEGKATWGQQVMDWLKAGRISRVLIAFILLLSRLFPAKIAIINKIAGKIYFREEYRSGVAEKVLTVPMPPRHREMEYAIPAHTAPSALNALRAYVLENHLAVNFIVELRFVAADDILLSPAFGRDTCFMGAYMGKNIHIEPYFSHFEAQMQALGGRPHWGKEFTASSEVLQAVCPNLVQFNRLRTSCDPDRMFENSYIERVFSACSEKGE